MARSGDWDREEFLDQTCMKAGLARDAWREAAEALEFSAEVFGESEGAKQTR